MAFERVPDAWFASSSPVRPEPAEGPRSPAPASDLGWIIFFLLLVGFIWWLTSSKTKLKRHMEPTLKLPPKPTRSNSTASKPISYKNYQDKLFHKPIDQLDEEEKIVRRARNSLDAERKNREAESRTKQKALEVEQDKIRRANELIRASQLDMALPFVQERTRHWRSWWFRRDESQWKPPMPISDIDGSEGFSGDEWVEFRADGGPLYKIHFQKPSASMISDSKYHYSVMTLSVNGEEVLAMSVSSDQSQEWPTWHFLDVGSLRVGPWIEGFIGFYSRLQSNEERSSQDRRDGYVREQAAKIDLGNLGGKR